MRFVVIGALCLIVAFGIVMVIKIDLVQYWEEDNQVCLESHYKKNYSKNF